MQIEPDLVIIPTPPYGEQLQLSQETEENDPLTGF